MGRTHLQPLGHRLSVSFPQWGGHNCAVCNLASYLRRIGSASLQIPEGQTLFVTVGLSFYGEKLGGPEKTPLLDSLRELYVLKKLLLASTHSGNRSAKKLLSAQLSQDRTADLLFANGMSNRSAKFNVASEFFLQLPRLLPNLIHLLTTKN